MADNQRWDGNKWVKIPHFSKEQLFKKVPLFMQGIKKTAKVGRSETSGVRVTYDHDPEEAERIIKKFIKFLPSEEINPRGRFGR